MVVLTAMPDLSTNKIPTDSCLTNVPTLAVTLALGRFR